MTMTLTNILQNRFSARAFIDKPVDEKLLKSIFTLAQQSPSSCNIQPWQTYVVSGKKKDELKALLVAELMKGNPTNPEFNWQAKYEGVYRERQFGSANALYNALNIAREDKQGRQLAMVRNWQFFDAPHAAFFTIEKSLNTVMAAVDTGIYAQTLSLLLAEHGIASCMQGALGQFPAPVKKLLNIPDQFGILFGMSFGYADENAGVNKRLTDREDISDTVTFF